MANYERRLKQLEEQLASATTPPDLVVLYVMPGGHVTSARIVVPGGHGVSVDRLPDESKDAMIARARRQITERSVEHLSSVA